MPDVFMTFSKEIADPSEPDFKAAGLVSFANACRAHAGLLAAAKPSLVADFKNSRRRMVRSPISVRRSGSRRRKLVCPGRLFNLCDLIDANWAEILHDATGPADLDVLDRRLCTQAKVDAAIAGRHEPDTCGDVVVESAPRSGDNFNSGADRVAIAAMPLQVEEQPVISV